MNPSPKDIEALALLKNLPVHFSIDGLTLFLMIAQLQLALRHPSNRGDSAEQIRQLTIDLQNQLITRSPDLKPILDKGWHPEFDINEYELRDFDL